MKIGDIVQRKSTHKDVWWNAVARDEAYEIIRINAYSMRIRSSNDEITVYIDSMELFSDTDKKPFKIGDKILLKNGVNYFDLIISDIRDNDKAIKSSYGVWYNLGTESPYKFIAVLND